MAGTPHHEHIIHDISHMQDKFSYRATYEAKALGTAAITAMAMVVVETKRSFIVSLVCVVVVVVVVSIALQKLWQQVRGGSGKPF